MKSDDFCCGKRIHTRYRVYSYIEQISKDETDLFQIPEENQLISLKNPNSNKNQTDKFKQIATKETLFNSNFTTESYFLYYFF